MAQLLSEVAVGTTVKINENGCPVDFYVSQHDYESSKNGAGRILLVRAEACEDSIQWNASGENTYGTSTIDTWLNETYKARLEADIQNAIGQTSFWYSPGPGRDTRSTLSRAIFALSIEELGYTTGGAQLGSAVENHVALRNYDVLFWTRSPTSKSSKVYCSNGKYGLETASIGTYFRPRPCFTIPGTVYVLDDGTISVSPPPPDTILLPILIMQNQTAEISWTAVDGAESYILERNADNGEWTQIYSGANLSYTDTIGTWSTVQYRVKAGVSGVYGDYTTSNAISVVAASALVISGTDSDLGTLTGPVQYSVASDTGNAISVTETVNGVALRTYTATSGQQQSIAIPDLPTGSGSITIKASVQVSSGTVNQTRSWTYTKTAPTFPSGPFDIATLSKSGKTQFPLTLAECVKMPFGMRLDDFMKYWWKRRTTESHYEILESENISATSTAGREYYITTAAYSNSEFDLQYSDEVEADESGEIQLKNPSTVKISYEDYSAAASVLPGKYFKPQHDGYSNLPQPKHPVMYAVPGGEMVSRHESSFNSYYVWYTLIRTLSTKYVEENDEWEYVCSADRNAYPDSGESGGYEYNFLGMPFSLDNLLGGAKIATGSYVGTGTFGASNPTTLTLPFKAKFLIITSDERGINPYNSCWYQSLFWINGVTMCYIVNSGDKAMITQKENTMSFYSTGSANIQLNTSGKTYYYFAIG